MKYFESRNISEDKAITVYNLSIVAPGLCGGKWYTKSDIGPFPDYSKWCNKSFQTVLGYDIDKMLDPVNQDIKMIIEMQYQTYLPLSSQATETALKAIRFISALFRWVDDTYESLLAGGNIK